MINLVEYVVAIAAITLFLYTMMLRFNNPELTETQLFLRLIGM